LAIRNLDKAIIVAKKKPAPVLHFSVLDKWGQIVEVTEERWRHVVKGHPELTGQEDLVKDAIGSPEIVYQGDTADDKMFRSVKVSGSGFMLGGKVVIAVVNYASKAKLLTAYTTTMDPKKRVLWNRPP
jgi:hypothetical protein